MNKEDKLKRALGIKEPKRENVVEINWSRFRPILIGIILGVIILFFLYWRFLS